MKTLVAVTVAFLVGLYANAQSVVNIQLTSLTSTNCQITLTPTQEEFTTLSNVVFALRWKATRNIALGNPAPSSLIEITKSGPVRTSGGWKYQLFSGCGVLPGTIQPIVFNIPRSGTGDITIASDSYLQQLTVNGQYFVSVGGYNATGQITTTTTRSMQPGNEKDQNLGITLYFDPSTSNFYVKREGSFYNTFGQRVTLLNEPELIIVRKYQLQ